MMEKAGVCLEEEEEDAQSFGESVPKRSISPEALAESVSPCAKVCNACR